MGSGSRPDATPTVETIRTPVQHKQPEAAQNLSDRSTCFRVSAALLRVRPPGDRLLSEC